MYLRSKVEFSHSLRNSNDSQQGSGCDIGVAQIFISVSLELSFFDILGHNIVMQIGWNGGIKSLCISDEGSHCLSINFR
jgi:hypothetical protein